MMFESNRCPDSALLIENDMFKHFLNLNLTAPETESLDTEVATLMEFPSPGGRRRSRPILSDTTQPLTTHQKLHMSQRVVAATKRDLDQLRQKYEAVQNKFKVSSKEAEVRLARIRKEKSDFERKINPVRINGILMLEPSTAVQSLVGKSMPSLLLEYNGINQMLKCKMTKLLQKQQKMKELEEAVFKEVFQDVFEEKIEKDTDELQLKYSEVQHNLDALKEKMKAVSQQSVLLSERFDKQKQLLVKMEEELKFVEEKRVKAEALNKQLRGQVSETLAFDVKLYIEVKVKKKQLQKSIQTWERKVKVAEMVKKSQGKNKPRKSNLPRASSARAPHRDLKHAVKLPRTLPGRLMLYSGF
ncbi:coiled-coil domain-containing protein 113-like [Synchiropus splendidus]|uniref:coiled-coil domain-containing protein 113-like n=1 Tax=Synchiropus splendidus TaxID=270530 RepID=UPI00237E40D2|nr:coiled-coil domain-containing protein 113-like [Synchiropus splendidus]